MTQGWPVVLKDMCENNEITDLQLINLPRAVTNAKPSEKDDKFKECTNFVYAVYLPPGHHQFIIYCPKTHRAFC